MSRAYFRATSYMRAAGLCRAVVTLTPHEVSDSIDYFPEAVIVERTDGPAPGLWSKLAELVWSAAVEQRVADGPVLLSVPGSGVVRVELLPCQCNPWGPLCDACNGTGWVYVRKPPERTETLPVRRCGTCGGDRPHRDGTCQACLRGVA